MYASMVSGTINNVFARRGFVLVICQNGVAKKAVGRVFDCHSLIGFGYMFTFTHLVIQLICNLT